MRLTLPDVCELEQTDSTLYYNAYVGAPLRWVDFPTASRPFYSVDGSDMEQAVACRDFADAFDFLAAQLRSDLAH